MPYRLEITGIQHRKTDKETKIVDLLAKARIGDYTYASYEIPIYKEDGESFYSNPSRFIKAVRKRT